MKANIPYSQALRVKRICSTNNELHQSCKSLQEKFINRGYSEEGVSKQINKAKEKPRRDTLTQKTRKKCNRIPFVTAFNRTLPPVAKIMRTIWELLHLSPKTKNTFKGLPPMAFKGCSNLRNILGSNTIKSNKVKRHTLKKITGKSKPCFARADTLCCKLIIDAQTFKSNTTNKSYNIYHELTCKSEYVIYITECIKCKKQYVGKSEWPFNIRLNNHRKDLKRIDAIGTHQDVCGSGIVCAHPQIILNPTDKGPNSFFHFHYCLKQYSNFFISHNGSFGFMSHTYCFF